MTYLDPHSQVLKICPVCGTEFRSIAFHNKIYDTVQCYRRAKNKRRMERSQPETVTKIEEQRAQIESSRFFSTVYCPTAKQLDDYAKIIMLEMNDDKPIRITGSVPEWTPPKNIQLVEQRGIEPREWLLVAREESPLDALLGR